MKKVEKMLEELESSIKNLAREWKIGKLDADDLAQELRLLIVENYNYSKKYNKSWWITKFRWYLTNLYTKAQVSTKPLDKAVSLDELLEEEERQLKSELSESK